ncbi:MAG: HypC/HybG/HupF family hydrogenase formation chaperone [Ardenticatenaceae bacterium]|nr:HypC/HybG/HupF family hydrogenase formation chaperone [Anaerolineales bacterium]MCB8918020.1 HypC/HybG/HupF family hydrogenase formation chaperone [Ardenticatenaceae bacterium]
MCLGVPGKIVEIYEAGGLPMGKIDFGGVTREACLAYVPDAQVGEYTVIHVGFAISQLSEEEAQKTLDVLREIADIGEELGLTPEETG